MTVTIDFSPTEEEQLNQVSRHEGLEPTAYVKRLVQQSLPQNALVTHAQALLTQWQASDQTTFPPSVQPRPGETHTQALFRTWDEEDAHMTDAERRAEDMLWHDFENGLNETRTALGMRRLS